ncbi:TPA: hypothetical protein N0F65_006455 [Lagenidium giganteum]|uniref:Ubiquitin-like-conjugating enzyme ATG10 n=1 Tax=Lagenidium giganteum TaxID=4803 RepID=A0AAV2YZU9_9STRA|nr:TPA: hypothetical protein N0F65_006455 [Lagenidium giganteum]
MRLTYEAFCAEADALVALTQRQDAVDGARWDWRHGTRKVNDSCVCLRVIVVVRNADCVCVRAKSQLIDDDITDLPSMDDDVEDAAALAPPPQAQDGEQQPVIMDFHIVYHTVYQTPVLYFQASFLDGTPVPTDELTASTFLAGSNSTAAVVSMEEHPVLGRPFHFLHPCESATVMDLLLQHDTGHEAASCAYLISWLSLMMPVTGINPLGYLPCQKR